VAQITRYRRHTTRGVTKLGGEKMKMFVLAPRSLLAAAVAAAGLSLSACGSLTTNGVGASPSVGGVPYFLPKVMLNLSLEAHVDRQNVSLIAEQQYVGDADAGALALAYSQSLFSNDTIRIVPDTNGLLTTVGAQYDSRAAEAFAKLGELAGMLESSATSTQITALQIDPANSADLTEASKALTNALREWAWRESSKLGSASTTRQRAFFATVVQTSLDLQWKWDGAPATVAVGMAACGGNLCVRGKRPGRLMVWRCGDLAAFDATASKPLPYAACSRDSAILVSTLAISIPNAGPSIPLNLAGGVFADRTHTVVLEKGIVTEYKLTSNSEIEGFGTSAVGFVTAQVQAVANGLQSDTARVKAQTALVKEQVELVKAQKALKQAQSSDEDGGGDASDEPATDVPAPDAETPAPVADPPAPGDDGGNHESADETPVKPPVAGGGALPDPVPDRDEPANDAPGGIVFDTPAPQGGANESWSAWIFGPTAEGPQ
jgi:hypothetical protein